MKSLRSTLSLLIVSMSLVACGGDSDSDSDDLNDPLFRAVHLSPDAPAVNIMINDNTPLTGVEYRQASQFLYLDSGDADISVLVPALGGASALDATVNLEDDTKTTVIVANTVENGLPLTPIVIVDDIDLPENGNADITIVHGSTAAQVAAPAGVDIYVTTPEGDLVDPILTAVVFNTVSAELSVPEGDYRVRITPTSSDVVVYDSGTLALLDGVEYIAIAADDISDDGLVGLTILTDLESTPFVNVDTTN